MNRFIGFILGMVTFMPAVSKELPVQKDTSFVAHGNPIVKHKYTADPAALVHDGKIYLYAGHMMNVHRELSITCSMSGACSPLRI